MKIFSFLTKKKVASSDQKLQLPAKTGNVAAEEAAAIALAIHMYKREIHDMESLTITLKKVSRVYSPWSSKIYTLRQNPR
jgi:hypothetical protein